MLIWLAFSSFPLGAAPSEEPKLYLRVIVREPDPGAYEKLQVRATHIGGRGARANAHSPETLMPYPDRPGGRTKWFPLDVTGEEVPYSGVTLHLEPASDGQALRQFEKQLERIHMELELAVGTEPSTFDEIHRLRPILAHGNGVPFYYEAGDLDGTPERAAWLKDHITSLRAALVDAGFTEPVRIDPRHMRLGINLSNHRFGEGRYGMLSYDPDFYWLYGDLFALAGYNIGTRGRMRELYENHPYFHHNMVKVATGHRSVAPNTLPDRVSIPESLDEKYRKMAERAREGDGLVPIWRKLGDEIGVDRFEDTPRAREVLEREARIVTNDDPAVLGLNGWNQLKPVAHTNNPDEVSSADRLRYYATLRARNVLTAERYAVESVAVKKHLGPDVQTQVNMLGPMYYGGYSARFWYRQTPDYFRMGEIGAVDVLQVQGLNSAYPPGGPITLSLLSPKVAAQAASRNPNVEPELMHFAPRTPPEAWPHVVFSTLISGVSNIDWYRFGPRATGWEWFDTEKKMLAHAQLARKLKPLAPYLVEADALPEARVGILWAESTDLWQRHPRSYSKSELRSTFFALRLSDIESDLIREYMVENGELDRYELLFAAQHNVNQRVQRAILSWVKAGGTLVLTPGAMTHDAANRPTDLLADALKPAIVRGGNGPDQQASGEFSEFERLGRVRLVEEDEANRQLPVFFHRETVGGRADVLADYVDSGEPAARITSLGGGQIVVLGFFPGHTYAADSARAERAERASGQAIDEKKNELVSGTVRTGSPYWLSPNENARKLFVDLARRVGIKPTVRVNVSAVDAGLHVQEERAAILLANWRPGSAGEVTIEAPLPERFRGASARTLTGQPVRLDWSENGRVRLTVPLQSVQAVRIDRE